MRRFCRWAGTHAGRSAEWYRGTFSFSWSSWMCARLSVSPSTPARCSIWSDQWYAPSCEAAG